MKTKTLEEIEKEANEFNDKINSDRNSYFIFMVVSVFFYLVFSPSGLIQIIAYILFIIPAYLSSFKYPANNKTRYIVQTLSFLFCLYIYINYV